ncbi:hypothetical protein SCYAM73S_01874 [Streptomyces cyaneofuscatus]
MPRGPNVLTRVRRAASSVHRAVRTSVRVRPAPRSPTESSAADSTWACVPSIAPTASAGERPGTGPDRCWRASLRAFASGQVTVAYPRARVVMART